MKRVNNADVYVKLNPKIININNFTIKFYTVNAESFFIYKTNEDVIPIQREATIDDVDAIISGDTAVTEYYIRLYWSELLTLGEGVLQYLVLNSTKYLDRTTEFYINSNVIVDDESGSTYTEVIAELGAKIDGEIERSTSADTEHQEAINDEISTRQQNVLDLTDLLVNDYYTKTEVDNRIESASTPTDLSNYYTKSEVDTAIANVDVTDQLSGYVDTTDFNTYSGATDTKINSKLDATAYTPTDLSNYYNKSQVYNKTEVDTTIGTVNGKISSISGVVDTKLDSTAYTPTDLSDYYTKTEVDDKITQSGTFDPTLYYNKTDVDGKVSTLSGAIDTKLDATAYTPTDLSNYYQKSQTSGATEISTALASKLDSTAYTPTDLTNYYTKSETSGSTEISNALASKLDSTAYTPTDLTNYYTKTQTYNKTEVDNLVAGGSGSSGFIQVTNPTAETTVGLVNSLTEYYNTNIGNHAVIEGDGYSNNGTNYNIEAIGRYSHAEGRTTKANGFASHSEGLNTTASAHSSHAEGANTTASGESSHAEGSETTASGNYSHAEGLRTTASGNTSHAEGQSTKASSFSHAEGYSTEAIGNGSHAEGSNTIASGNYSHAEGSNTIASGNYSHAEGYSTEASCDESHAEGSGTTASGYYSHAEGYSTKASGHYGSHAEGNGTIASGQSSHAEGANTIANNVAEHASGIYNVSSSVSTTFGDSGNTLFSVGNGTSQTRHNAFEIRQNGDIYITSGSTDIKLQDHLGGDGGSSSGFIQITNPDTAETKVGLVNSLSQYYDTNIGKGAVIEGDGYESNGTYYNIVASGEKSHAEGWGTTARGDYSHAEGNYTTASGGSSHAEGDSTSATSDSSHAEGYMTVASGYSSHAEGSGTKAIGNYSHAEGSDTVASSNYSHAEGSDTVASGNSSHAEGRNTTASGNSSHAEGSSTIASGTDSHSEGYSSEAYGQNSHAEGMNTKASGQCSHSEGQYSQAIASYSHAEGSDTRAKGNTSHAEGASTIASGQSSHAEGKNTKAIGIAAHAEGSNTRAMGDNSHSQGYYTDANNISEFACGRYNKPFGDSNNAWSGSSYLSLFTIGNGENSSFHNAFRVMQNGEIYYPDTQLINTASTRYNSGFTYSNVPELCLQEQLEKFVSTEQLPNVAKTGSYEDLVNRPFGDFEEQVGESIYSNSGTLAQNGPSHYGFNGIELDTSNWTDGMTVNLILDDVLYGSGLITSGYSGADIVYWINATPNGSPFNDTWSVFLNGSYYAISIYNVQGTHKVELVIDEGTQIVTHKLDLKYLPIWTGTETEYNQITTKDNSTIYLLLEDND